MSDISNKHINDVTFTEESLLAFIGKIRNSIKDNLMFVSTSDMAKKKAEAAPNDPDFTPAENEINEVFPNNDNDNSNDDWGTKHAAQICIINNEIKKIINDEDLGNNDDNRSSGRYTWIQGGSLLNFETECELNDDDDPQNDRPNGTIYIDENNGTKIHVVQVKGFDNGNFNNATPGTTSSITTDIVYADSLGTENNYIPAAYITNLYTSTGMTSTGDLIIKSNTEAKRYTSGTSEDPAAGTEIGENINLLEGSIKTLGGIAARKSIKGYKVHGAVFNDYAEYRHTEQIQPGRCVIETGKGDLILSDKRLQLGGNIISDTYGFSIGETYYANTPIAVCGRVLAYTFEHRELFKPGEAVCSGPNGTISRMTREEIRNWPDAIIGYVSEIPDYEEWGSDKVKVDGRIWIKVK